MHPIMFLRFLIMAMPLVYAAVCRVGNQYYADGDVYPSQMSECVELKCNGGTWEFNVITNPNCGECNVEGDPHIQTFDESEVYIGDCTTTTTTSTSTITPCPKTTTQQYLLNKCGTYIVVQPHFAYSGTSITTPQPGFPYPASFGVTSVFAYCSYLKDQLGYDLEGQCIVSTTYYEHGVANIIMILPPAWIAASCVTANTDPRCDIEVVLNGNILKIGNSVIDFHGILIFKHEHISGSKNLNCISIIGTQGLRVTLCEHYQNLPYMFITAVPSLNSHLYGLCNTFTGGTATNMVLKNGTLLPSTTCLRFDGYEYKICEPFTDSWEFTRTF